MEMLIYYFCLRGSALQTCARGYPSDWLGLYVAKGVVERGCELGGVVEDVLRNASTLYKTERPVYCTA